MFKSVLKRVIEALQPELDTVAHYIHALTHGGAHDLVDKAKSHLHHRKPRHRETSDVYFMKRARSRNLKKALAAVARIEKDANLLAVVKHGSVDRPVRIAAIRRIRHQGTLTSIVFGYDIDFALTAIDGIHDQNAIALILKDCPWVSVRRRAISRCDTPETLHESIVLDPDYDVKTIAREQLRSLNERLPPMLH